MNEVIDWLQKRPEEILIPSGKGMVYPIIGATILWNKVKLWGGIVTERRSVPPFSPPETAKPPIVTETGIIISHSNLHQSVKNYLRDMLGQEAMAPCHQQINTYQFHPTSDTTRVIRKGKAGINWQLIANCSFVWALQMAWQMRKPPQWGIIHFSFPLVFAEVALTDINVDLNGRDTEKCPRGSVQELPSVSCRIKIILSWKSTECYSEPCHCHPRIWLIAVSAVNASFIKLKYTSWKLAFV